MVKSPDAKFAIARHDETPTGKRLPLSPLRTPKFVWFRTPHSAFRVWHFARPTPSFYLYFFYRFPLFSALLLIFTHGKRRLLFQAPAQSFIVNGDNGIRPAPTPAVGIFSPTVMLKPLTESAGIGYLARLV